APGLHRRCSLALPRSPRSRRPASRASTDDPCESPGRQASWMMTTPTTSVVVRAVVNDVTTCAVLAGLVDQVLQLLAGLEVRDLLRRDVHFVAGLGVAALAGLALTKAKAAESSQLDLFAPMQRVDDAFEDGVHDDLRVFLREVRNA